jgi:hypothetical protein
MVGGFLAPAVGSRAESFPDLRIVSRDSAVAALQGVPQNFTVLATQRDPSGALYYLYRWFSSTRKLKDLSTCTFELFLDYPMKGTHFAPQRLGNYFT